jgi:hypothetical protein
MSPFNIGFNSPPAARVAARDTVMLRGGNRRPSPPVSIIAQPGSQKVLVSWQIPSDSKNLGCSTRVYLDDELHLIQTIAPGQTYTQIPLSGGSNPPIRGLFFSLITPAGIESRKVFVTGRALVDSSDGDRPTARGWRYRRKWKWRWRRTLFYRRHTYRHRRWCGCYADSQSGSTDSIRCWKFP